MAKDGSKSSQAGSSQAGGAAARPGKAAPVGVPPTTPHCHCGHPMHPEHVEKRRGLMLERYCCPRRRWWNFMLHPHVWMQPRDPVTHHHN
ncbi:hypothetical protein [Longimicrobium sp.]|uniref:hypothetical protein n=1 Tax=Longimicrobium sp. TaxID=2029185 RepID=UPI002CF869B7|nr:hypothetical protein [Longimicrobium sp.]HSU14912.1 hypothetical protein [Longimicrobium sp.]